MKYRGDDLMENTIDARNEACPRPVIMTKKQLDNMENGKLITIVDNEVAKENVSKLVKSLGYEFSIEKLDKDYYIHIVKGNIIGNDLDKSKSKDQGHIKDMAIGFSSYTMGKGDKKLGVILMKSFIYTVSETKPYPKTLLFYNEGVRLTCEGSQVLDDLRALEEKGVEIISCGTCLDFLNLKEDLKIGSISNMYTIYEELRNPQNNMIIG